MRCIWRLLAVLVVLLLADVGRTDSARAGVLSILRDMGEAGGKAASHLPSELGPVGKALSHLEGLAEAPQGALAAHATPEGHWQFVNRDGQTFTAGTAEEFKHVLPTLAPDAKDGGKLTLYVSEDSVFANRASLKELPADAELYVVTDAGAYAVMHAGGALLARVRPNLVMELSDQAGFEEAVSYLGRPLNGANVRTLALEPGGAKYISAAPKFEPASKEALVDQIDPEFLASGLGAIRGQTMLLTGRVEGGKLIVPASAGGTISQDIDALKAAARNSDVNLVVLNSDAAVQPGGRNWLWQKVEVGGLADARRQASVGDFLDALAAPRGGFKLTAEQTAYGRVHISALPDPSAAGLGQQASDFWTDAVAHVTGKVVTKAIEIEARDAAAQTELDAEFIPGIPSAVQYSYIFGLVAGVLGWSSLRSWWLRIWKPRPRQPGENRAAFVARRVPGELLFWLAFAPVAGIPAFAVQAAIGFWEQVMAPFKWLRRKFLMRQV
jgi:hypothetical protein